MGFILIDFKRMDEDRRLKQYVADTIKKMDQWIRDYENDGTPPNEEEAAALEEEKINELLSEYDDYVPLHYYRVNDKFAHRREKMERKLHQRQGRLFAKFRDDVWALEDKAIAMMTFCKEELEELEEVLTENMPMDLNTIVEDFDSFLACCREYIDMTYPDGVEGMDAYDDDLPEGLMPFTQFVEMVEAKKLEYMTQNEESKAPAIEKVKGDAKEMCRSKINEAVKQALADIQTDLADDKLAYLDDEDMEELRSELIAYAEDYAKTRMDGEWWGTELMYPLASRSDVIFVLRIGY